MLADEHVDRAYVQALRSNGYPVEVSGDDYATGSADEALLDRCLVNRRVFLTNDRDFIELHHAHAHAGIVLYAEQGRSVGEMVSAIRRVDHHFTRDEIENRLIWLDQWMGER